MHDGLHIMKAQHTVRLILFRHEYYVKAVLWDHILITVVVQNFVGGFRLYTFKTYNMVSCR